MERPPKLEQAASQLSNITRELTDDNANVGIGKTFNKETKERFFVLFVYCKTRKVARLLRKEIGDVYEDLPVVYRPIGKIVPV